MPRWWPVRLPSIVRRQAIDGSDRSAAAARTAARLAMALGTRLELVHVVMPPKTGLIMMATPRGAFRDFLWPALRTLDAMPPVDLVLDAGDPARRLRTFAESERALLVIGAPANAGREDGVASAIVADSHVPVVLVPAPQRSQRALIWEDSRQRQEDRHHGLRDRRTARSGAALL
jgi:nucleotide-binding universal stress UspA family protein